jgi:hypothetical protein
VDRDGALDRMAAIVGPILADIAAVPVVRLAALGLGISVVTVWLATAWWTMADLRRRHPDPALPYLAAALVVIATPLLCPLALVVYLIVRPPRTRAESRRLELEDRLDQLDEQDPSGFRCATCRTQTEDGWLRCPSCRARLGYACAACGRSMAIDWVVCAWCATPVGEGQAEHRRIGERRRIAGGKRRTGSHPVPAAVARRA